MTSLDPAIIAEEAKRLYAQKQYHDAAQSFSQAAKLLTQNHDNLLSAEMSNNESVAWLQGGMPREAYKAAKGTDKVFEDAKDIKRQAIAISNQAAALTALKQKEEALALYNTAYQLFDEIGEKDMRSYISRAIAEINFGQGNFSNSALKMLGSLESKEQPSLRERILLSLLRFFYRRIYRTK